MDGRREPAFLIPEQALAHFREAVARGTRNEMEWTNRMASYAHAFPALAKELERSIRGDLPAGWDANIPSFPADVKGLATRVASGRVMNAIAPLLPALTGGSADLNPSTHTALKDLGDFGAQSFTGRNLHYGVREHAMGAITNGLAAHGGTLPYGATFLVFSDYMRPPIRLAALMKLHVIHVFTHDSIALGEDGPTHQPVEQLAALRGIPNVIVIRPADANETAVAWRVACEVPDRPVILVLTRQSVPTLDRQRFASADALRHGAYVLTDAPGGRPELILIASGSEVALMVAAADRLQSQSVAVRCVSMPSWELFNALPRAEQDVVLPPAVTPRLAIEMGASQGWRRYVGDAGDVLSVERFGASAPGEVVQREYGFTVDEVCRRALSLISARR